MFLAMEDEGDILIIGAGAAGLAAARELSAADLKVIVLEARDRIGGRINTHFDTIPIELGAEFIHGTPPQTFKIVERLQLSVEEIPNRHWHLHNGVLTKAGEFWSKVEDVMTEMNRYEGPDTSFAAFLGEYQKGNQIEDLESIATMYVEGFHAAHADDISVGGLNKTNAAAEEIHEDCQFRIKNGYKLITQTLYDEAVGHGASFRFGAVVEEVRWQKENVGLLTTTGDKFKARRVLVTLPLSLLQSEVSNKARVRFVPALEETVNAANKLKMGKVVKVMLRFKEAFWKELTLPGDDGRPADLDDLTFIHSPVELLPTWWTQFPADVPLLAGWAGGTRAERLLRESDDSLLDHSMQTLAHIFQTPKRILEQSLVAFYTHNWQNDPLAAGAYSYIPVGGTEAQAQLARPLENTLFFAGEATNTEGHQGTVHGAIASGLRAAREILSLHTGISN